MSEGTSLEDIETGNVANQADSAVMNAILSDMNALPEEQPQRQNQQPAYIPPPQQPPQQPPHMQASPEFQTPFLPPPPPPVPMYSDFASPDPYTMDVQQPFDVYTPIPQATGSQSPNQVVAEAPGKRQNGWSNVFGYLMDGLFVAIIVGVLSLPVLHTRLASYASWAYKVGGELSWWGLTVVSLVGGVLYTAYRIIATQTKVLEFINTL